MWNSNEAKWDRSRVVKCETESCPNNAHYKGLCLPCHKIPGIFVSYKGDWGKSMKGNRFSGRYMTKQQNVSRIVWKVVTGQDIPPGYVVHHKDENPLNDQYENLELMTISEHERRHMKTAAQLAPEKLCRKCGKTLPLSKFKIRYYNALRTPIYRSTCQACRDMNKRIAPRNLIVPRPTGEGSVT